VDEVVGCIITNSADQIELCEDKNWNYSGFKLGNKMEDNVKANIPLLGRWVHKSFAKCSGLLVFIEPEEVRIIRWLRHRKAPTPQVGSRKSPSPKPWFMSSSIGST
jgi:hypothetical protein